ncbi:MAG: energy transducer TonB [Spirochaetes bacterium]|nr:energy transducer TonB [Spirochaetota bacterium]
MAISILRTLGERLKTPNLFRICLAFSMVLHLSAYAAYYIRNLPDEAGGEEEEITTENMEVDFEDVPMDISPDMVSNDLFTDSNPAPVEKSEWIEGSGGTDAPDAEVNDESINAISGDGTDKDGYYYSFRGDRPPVPIIDFELSRYFPKEAKRASITEKLVVVRIQVDADGTLKGARVVSRRAGFGFEEAAMKVIRRARFRPGYIAGRPTKMTHEIPIRFVLE